MKGSWKRQDLDLDLVVGVAVVIPVWGAVLNGRLEAKTEMILDVDLGLVLDKKSVPSSLPFSQS